MLSFPVLRVSAESQSIMLALIGHLPDDRTSLIALSHRFPVITSHDHHTPLHCATVSAEHVRPRRQRRKMESV
jgi:hypothetical protein